MTISWGPSGPRKRAKANRRVAPDKLRISINGQVPERMAFRVGFGTDAVRYLNLTDKSYIGWGRNEQGQLCLQATTKVAFFSRKVTSDEHGGLSVSFPAQDLSEQLKKTKQQDYAFITSRDQGIPCLIATGYRLPALLRAAS